MTKCPPPPNEETFHKARSRLIDSFARLENRTVLSLSDAGWPIQRDTLASKLKTLREAAKGQKGLNVDPMLERISQLNQTRADIVHGVMTIIDIDGDRFVCFRNATEAINDVQRPSLVAYKDLKKFADELDNISEKIAALPLTPPSSPQPPSQAAAAGP